MHDSSGCVAVTVRLLGDLVIDWEYLISGGSEFSKLKNFSFAAIDGRGCRCIPSIAWTSSLKGRARCHQHPGGTFLPGKAFRATVSVGLGGL
jgi:hypothetical protein